jgi:hypothetical protein
VQTAKRAAPFVERDVALDPIGLNAVIGEFMLTPRPRKKPALILAPLWLDQPDSR